jgi:Dolichyl-phosphate-mannose-protein mannosyltransferase
VFTSLSRRQVLLVLFLLALFVTVLNACKPLTIDDAAYYYFARQDARQALDPYGAAVFWWNQPQPANEILAPPVLPYWWSLAIRLFGEHPFLWKLWLLPFVVLFVGVLYALFRRFARGLELPLVFLTVLSPTFLPSLNLMLDVPQLALSLAALVLFLKAVDRGSVGLAALAGLVAGLGMETKYTGFVVVGVMLLYALTHGKPWLWPAVALVAAQVFVSWELLTALLYGQSHFLYAARAHGGVTFWDKVGLWLPLLGYLGSIGPPVGLLALAGLKVRRRLVLLAALLCLVPVALAAWCAVSYRGTVNATLHREHVPWGPTNPFEEDFPTTLVISQRSEHFAFALPGLVGVVIVGMAAARLCRWSCARGWATAVELDATLFGGGADAPAPLGDWLTFGAGARTGWFLFLWLVVEVAGYFLLTPFPAVRRVMGIVVVATLVAGRLASRTCRGERRQALVLAIVVFSALLGLGYAGLDFREAQTEKAMAEGAAAYAREHGAGDVWFVGHWGFQYYAEHAGMKMLVTDYVPQGGSIELPPPSLLKVGDWVVEPDYRLTQQPAYLDPTYLEPVTTLELSDPIPLQTIMCYYGGDVALEHRIHRNRLSVQLYRVKAEFVPKWRGP